jgi:rRNA-processing protein FCF1
MDDVLPLRSVSFDTSFLLKNSYAVDRCIAQLAADQIPCYITSTVVSELEQLKVHGRITASQYRIALRRWHQTHATVIDFRNRLLSNAFGKACMSSMKKHHGVENDNIANDCTILVSVLKHGVDIFLSEDFHFTSKISQNVIHEVSDAACVEYHQMCDTMLYSVNSGTFLKAYTQRSINLKVIEEEMKNIRKSGKRLHQEENP